MNTLSFPFVNRELSWLSFNERVLQEAADPTVPLIEKIKFLSIFSSNLDEFYRVRVATLNRLTDINTEAKELFGYNPKKTLKQIKELVVKQEVLFNQLYEDIFKTQLAQEHIELINEYQIHEQYDEYVKEYFRTRVLATLVPVLIGNRKPFPELKDQATYFWIRLKKDSKSLGRDRYAVMELPDKISRFVVLPQIDGKHKMILLDDIIRYCLDDVFFNFEYAAIEAYSIQLTRDAELDLDKEVNEKFLERLSKGLQKRKKGKPMRLLYDVAMPADLFAVLTHKLDLNVESLIPGNRYLNFKDFITFPNVAGANLENPITPPLPVKGLEGNKSVLARVTKKDFLINLPYQSFDHIIHFLREAAIDPNVIDIHITLYRLAKDSKVINALINAARNGKKVYCLVEVTARFDEQANINWTQRLEEENVQVIYGLPGYKVHSKICLVTRLEKSKKTNYVLLSTGNFNESTAKLYADHTLLTSNPKITTEAVKFFSALNKNRIPKGFKHLIVSPTESRQRWLKLIDNEIACAKAGKKAYMILKMNSLTDNQMIKKLYDASNAGVKIQLIIRGMCCLIPHVEGFSQNIEACSIIDKYLEHARVFIFGNGGAELLFLSSADWMSRNLDNRIEIGFPIYDQRIKKEIKHIIELQLQDNTKARALNYKKRPISSTKNHRSQVEIYDYLKINN